jgi:hypothetical protein
MLMLVLSLSLLADAGAQRATCTPQFAPLTSGTSVAYTKLPVWRKEEAGAWNGGGWLGWSYESNALLPMQLRVSNLPKRDEDDSEEVTVEAKPRLQLAVRCIPALRAGPIVSADVVNESLMEKPVRVAIGERHYELRLESKRKDYYDAKVVLTEGGRRQVLYEVDGFADEPVFDIVWAGDLDRDGRLDLVTILSHKYSMHPYRLHLSSMASRTQLVGVAAIFETGD